MGGDSPTAIEALALRHLGEAQTAHGGHIAAAIRTLPSVVELDTIGDGEMGSIPLMLNDNFEFHGPSLERHLLVVGPNRSGRSTALLAISRLLAEKGGRSLERSRAGMGPCLACLS